MPNPEPLTIGTPDSPWLGSHVVRGQGDHPPPTCRARSLPHTASMPRHGGAPRLEPPQSALSTPQSARHAPGRASAPPHQPDAASGRPGATTTASLCPSARGTWGLWPSGRRVAEVARPPKPTGGCGPQQLVHLGAVAPRSAPQSGKSGKSGKTPEPREGCRLASEVQRIRGVRGSQWRKWRKWQQFGNTL